MAETWTKNNGHYRDFTWIPVVSTLRLQIVLLEGRNLCYLFFLKDLRLLNTEELSLLEGQSASYV